MKGDVNSFTPVCFIRAVHPGLLFLQTVDPVTTMIWALRAYHDFQKKASPDDPVKHKAWFEFEYLVTFCYVFRG